MNIRILPSALADLRKGRRFYEQQKRGLGSYFFDSLFTDIDKLHHYAGIHPIHWGHHRMLAKRFPYAIYYLLDTPDLLTVRRILDLRRNPDHMKEQLTGIQY